MGLAVMTFLASGASGTKGVAGFRYVSSVSAGGLGIRLAGLAPVAAMAGHAGMMIKIEYPFCQTEFWDKHGRLSRADAMAPSWWASRAVAVKPAAAARHCARCAGAVAFTKIE